MGSEPEPAAPDLAALTDLCTPWCVHVAATPPTFVRTGSSGYADVFGRPFCADLAAHPQISADFDRLTGPAEHGMPSPGIGLAEGWDGVR